MSQQSFRGALPPLKRKLHQGVGVGGQKGPSTATTAVAAAFIFMKFAMSFGILL